MGGFDFVKAGRIASVVFKGSRAGARKIASRAYVELERLAREDEKTQENFSTAGAVEVTNTTTEGEK